MTAVTLTNLSKIYGPTTAVAQLNLAIEEGELLVLLGPSGSGKTTILRLIAGLLRPSQGDILFDGQSVLVQPPEKRGAVMVFQEHALFPFMSVGDNVAFGLKMRGLAKSVIQERVAAALTAVQLPDFASRWPDELSGGQRQRVALARALVIRPNILLLDEPLSNLEPGLREELRQMIVTLQKEAGITTLFVTHDQAEAVAMADRIALLMNGRLQQVGRARDFYENPADLEVAHFFGKVNVLRGIKQGAVVHTGIGSLEIAPSTLPDGDVWLTIRPEAIEIGRNGHNNLPAQIQKYAYQGLSAQFITTIADEVLQVSAAPFRQLTPGQVVTLHLPRERICLFPMDEKLE